MITPQTEQRSIDTGFSYCNGVVQNQGEVPPLPSINAQLFKIKNSNSIFDGTSQQSCVVCLPFGSHSQSIGRVEDSTYKYLYCINVSVNYRIFTFSWRTCSRGTFESTSKELFKGAISCQINLI